jgi:sulfatase modifying factor 1
MRALSTAAWAFLLVGCGEAPPEAPDATVAVGAGVGEEAAAADAAARTAVPEEGASPAATGEALMCTATGEAEGSAEEGASPGPSAARAAEGGCPDDMVRVETTFCPDIERTCLDMEHEAINNLDICHAFAHAEHCRLRPRPIAFCIDQYEYPNRSGAHPTWMLDWYKAQATCESKGKRLCYASEWTAACEGPQHAPFPYGWERDHDKCNIDNFFIEPKKWPNGAFLFYSRDPKVALGELARLDQSVPSGAFEACTSGFGVHDMTGNIDEWVVSDVAPREKSLWAGLKGGAWGHVRSQCRPTTYSHDPGFSYYFVGFRCCSDAPGAPTWTPAAQAMRPPEVDPHDFAPEPVVVSDASGPSKTKFTRSGHRQ